MESGTGLAREPASKFVRKSCLLGFTNFGKLGQTLWTKHFGPNTWRQTLGAKHLGTNTWGQTLGAKDSNTWGQELWTKTSTMRASALFDSEDMQRIAENEDICRYAKI